MYGSKIDDLILDAFDKLDPYYTESKSKGKKNSISGETKSNYKVLSNSIKASYEETTNEVSKRVLPVQLTPSRLIDFMGEAKCIWLIEDFHKVEESEKNKLSQIMKMFVDKSNTYKKTKVIAIGAVGTAREVVNYDKELNSRVFELHVPLLEKKEIKSILKTGTELLNISFSNELINKIAHYSNRLGSVAHQLSLNICQNNNIYKTQKKYICFDDKDLEESVNSFLMQKSDSYKELYDKITNQKERKYENVKDIFNAMVKLDKEEYTHAEILAKIKEVIPEYPQGNLSHYLQQLSSNKWEEVLRFDENSRKYSFSEPLFKAYVIMKHKNEDKNENDDISMSIKSEHYKIVIRDVYRILNNEFKEE